MNTATKVKTSTSLRGLLGGEKKQPSNILATTTNNGLIYAEHVITDRYDFHTNNCYNMTVNEDLATIIDTVESAETKSVNGGTQIAIKTVNHLYITYLMDESETFDVSKLQALVDMELIFNVKVIKSPDYNKYNTVYLNIPDWIKDCKTVPVNADTKSVSEHAFNEFVERCLSEDGDILC